MTTRHDDEPCISDALWGVSFAVFVLGIWAAVAFMVYDITRHVFVW